MVKRYVLACMILLLTACGDDNAPSEVTSLHGELQMFDENRFVIDCSDRVVTSKGAQADIGYLCEVQINEETIIRTQSGENLAADALLERPSVMVIIEPATLGQSQENRKVKAKEIIIEK